MNPSDKSQCIMVVDDQPGNLKLMEGMLRQEGYEVRSFSSGRMALAAAAHQQPDLILLDVNMPEMSGYEVCAQLKSDINLSEIPVIFLSALHDTRDKVKGLRAGGVDYIAKPFQFEEVYARIETHLKLRDSQQELKLQNRLLEEIVDSRTRELNEAQDRLLPGVDRRLGVERRKEIRMVSKPKAATLAVAARMPIEMQVTDVSRNGLGIVTPSPVLVGSSVVVICGGLTINGTVRHCRPTPDGKHAAGILIDKIVDTCVGRKI